MDALSALAGVQRSAKQYKEAAATYDQAISAIGIPSRDNWTLFYFRGICYERAKEWPKAEDDFKKALELFPDQPLVLNYLGYSWVDQGVKLDEAFKMLRRAVELRPNDGYIVDSLGWAHYKLGQYTKRPRLWSGPWISSPPTRFSMITSGTPIGMSTAKSRRSFSGITPGT